MSTYAAYYNIICAQRSQAEKAAQANGLEKSLQVSNNNNSRRSSSVDSRKRRFSVKSVLELLRPTTERITPEGVYAAPMTKRGRSPLGQSDKEAVAEQARKHSVTQAAVEGALLRN